MADIERTRGRAFERFKFQAVNDSTKDLFADDKCEETAREFDAQLQENPDRQIIAFTYDRQARVFLVTHRIDGKYPMQPEKFYAVFAKKVIGILSGRVHELLEKVTEKPKAA